MGALYTAIPKNDAIELICSHLYYEPKSEFVPLADAIKRVSSCDIVSRLNLPNVKSSRWDGIVFRYDDWKACGGDLHEWVEGKDYIFSNTGLGIFADFDTMVKIEETVFENGQLKSLIFEELTKGDNVIPIGERVAKGSVLVHKDTYIKPAHLNRLASGGIIHVPVYVKPRVAIIPTGNELVTSLSLISPGENIESNSFSMAAKTKLKGGEPIIFPIVPDDKEIIMDTIREAALTCDIIVTGAGSGRGQKDLMGEVLESLGTVYFYDVEHGPGKKTSFSVVNNTPVIGLVGPSGGEELTFDFYVVPAIEACLNQKRNPKIEKAILDDDLPPHTRVSFFYILDVYTKDGELHAKPLSHANFDAAIADYNAVTFVPLSHPGYKKGDVVEVEIRESWE